MASTFRVLRAYHDIIRTMFEQRMHKPTSTFRCPRRPALLRVMEFCPPSPPCLYSHHARAALGLCCTGIMGRRKASPDSRSMSVEFSDFVAAPTEVTPSMSNYASGAHQERQTRFNSSHGHPRHAACDCGHPSQTGRNCCGIHQAGYEGRRMPNVSGGMEPPSNSHNEVQLNEPKRRP